MAVDTSNPFQQGRNPRFDKIATRLAHWTWALFVLAIPSQLLVIVFDPIVGFWPSTLLTASVTAVLILTAVTVMAWHVYALCPVCARKTPLDPQAAIAKKRRQLRVFHWLAEKHHKALNRTLLALLIAGFLPYTTIVAWPLLMLSVALLVHLQNVHMPLQPWCPQCRWDGGGGKERVPQPEPIGQAVK